MTDTVKAWIEERRRIREHEPTMFERADTEVAYPRALNALQAVLGLHKPDSVFGDCLRCHEQYPCPTVQTIEGAIND